MFAHALVCAHDPDTMCMHMRALACVSPAAALPQACNPLTTLLTSMLLRYAVHPKGLDPFQAAKAWLLRVEQGLPWQQVRSLVRTASGMPPGQDALEDAVARVDAQHHTAEFARSGAATMGYARCGRTPMLTSAQKLAVVHFVKRWRSKRFCTANYIIQELKLACKKKTVHRALNEAGYHWRPVAKKGKLTQGQLAKRKAFVDSHLDKTAAWWCRVACLRKT